MRSVCPRATVIAFIYISNMKKLQILCINRHLFTAVYISIFYYILHFCYYFCHCMSLHVCPGESLILGCRFGHCLGKTLSFWLSACSVLIVVPLLYVCPSFPLVS